MKGGGIRGLYVAVANAIANMAAPAPAAPTIMDRAPGFVGVFPKRSRIMRNYVRNNGGMGKPHHGNKECERRRRQLGLGEYRNTWDPEQRPA